MSAELKFGALLVLLSATTAVCAQRYQGCVTKGVGRVEITGHPGTGPIFAQLGAPTWCMDLTVDDSQNVTFHEFTMEYAERATIAENVFFDLVATNMMADKLDLNPIVVDNKFIIKHYPNTPLQVSGTYFNRSFENEFSGTLHPIGASSGVLNYAEYPEKITFEHDSYWERVWENRTDVVLEPELVLRIIKQTVQDLSIELLPVPPAEANGVIGDSNLDGIFNSGDMITVFAAGEYEDGIPLNSTWREGDWNSDLDFDTADLIYAFQNGSYSAAARPLTVPEPSLAVAAMVACVVFARKRRK